MHLLTNLFRRFQFAIEFLFVETIFVCKKSSKSAAAFLQVSCVLRTHLLHAALNNAFGDHFVGFSFPVSLVRKVAVASEVIVELLQALKMVTATDTLTNSYSLRA